MAESEKKKQNKPRETPLRLEKLAGKLHTADRLRQFHTRIINHVMRAELTSRQAQVINSHCRSIAKLIEMNDLEKKIADVEVAVEKLTKGKQKGRLL